MDIEAALRDRVRRIEGERDALRAEVERLRRVVEAVRAYQTDDRATFEAVDEAMAALDAAEVKR